MKYIYTILLIGFIFNAVAQNQITLKTDIPGSIQAGEDIIVNVTVEKADLTSFATYTQAFPDGFIITENRTGEGIFKFEDQKLTVTWYRLPERNKVNFSYNIEINNSLKGKFPLKGRFTYFEKNKKGNIYTDTTFIEIGNTGVIKANSTKNKQNTGKQKDNNTNNNVSQSKDTRTINCKRNKIFYDKDLKGFVVEISIETNNINTAARVSETIPEGYKAEVIDGKGSQFGFVSNKVSLVWNKLPRNKSIKIKYILLSEKSEVPNIKGTITYFKNTRLQEDNIKQLK